MDLNEDAQKEGEITKAPGYAWLVREGVLCRASRVLDWWVGINWRYEAEANLIRTEVVHNLYWYLVSENFCILDADPDDRAE